MGRVLGEPLLATMAADGWKAALSAVTQRWRRPEPLVIAFDEFQGTAGVTTPFEIGESWDKTTQIDVVGLRQDGWTDLGECKWGKHATAGQTVDELLPRVPCYPNARNATIAARIFTRRPIRETQQTKYRGVRFHGVDELYGDAPRRRRR